MKDFHFKKFSVKQNTSVFRVGTDAVLLGALSSVQDKSKILEIGSGCGVISLMLAQRNPHATIIALDISDEAFQLTSFNFINSPFQARLSAKCGDINAYQSSDKFDFVVCNPPYFEPTSVATKDQVARQHLYLNFLQLIIKVSQLLEKNGIFAVIIPTEAASEFMQLAEKHQLFVRRKIQIFGREGLKSRRVILEFSPLKSGLDLLDFFIEKSPRTFSDQYLAATKDFHLFK